jgi:hypothetical protein
MSADASRNWRESLTPQQRASVQKHIFTRLAALVEGVSEKDLWARSVTFEEREFARASSQQEYLHRIAVGLQNAERAVGGHAEAPQGAPASRPAKQQPAQASSDTLLMAPLPRRLNEWQEHPVDATEVQLDEQRKRARSACSNSSAPTVRETRPPRTQSMTSIPFGMEARVQSVQSAPPADNERSPCSFSVSSSVDGARAAQIAQVSRTDGTATGAAPIGGRISGSTTNFKRANTPLAPNLFNPQQKEVIRTVLDAYQEMPEELRAHGFGALPPHVIERLAQVFPNDPIVFAAFAAAMAVGTAQREVLYVRFIAALNAAREAAARYAISKSLSMAAASVSAQMSSPNLRRSISVGAPETLFAASPNLTRPLSGHAMENEVHESPTRVFAELADFQAREGQVFRGALGIIRTALQKQTDPYGEHPSGLEFDSDEPQYTHEHTIPDACRDPAGAKLCAALGGASSRCSRTQSEHVQHFTAYGATGTGHRAHFPDGCSRPHCYRGLHRRILRQCRRASCTVGRVDKRQSVPIH